MGGNTSEQIKGAHLDRVAQERVGHPPDGVLKQMVSNNIPKNMPIGLDSVADALAVYGTPVSRLKGAKTREKTHPRVGEGGKLETPQGFYRLNKFSNLTADVMFVSGIPFLVTLSRKIKRITAEYVPSLPGQQLANYLTKIVNAYARGGFVIDLYLMDMEFEKVREKLANIEVNTTAAREHVHELEHHIRLIKEHVICTTSDFPFDTIPILVLIHVVYTCVMWINDIPRTTGAVQGIPPRELVTGRTVTYKRDCLACIGGYVEASTDATATNDNTPRTHSCIALGPSGNRRCSVKCFDLET